MLFHRKRINGNSNVPRKLKRKNTTPHKFQIRVKSITIATSQKYIITVMVSYKHPFLLSVAIIACASPLSSAMRNKRRKNRARGKNNAQDVIQNLVANRQHIQRDVKETENGIVASTWSLEDNVSGWIKTHVRQMKALMDSDDGVIRQWDDLFREAFALRDFHHMDVKYNKNGVEVEQVGDNDCAVAIAKAHAAVVSKFIERGRKELRLNHEVPEQCA